MNETNDMPGYSGKSLASKLGIGDSSVVLVLSAPPEYRKWLGDIGAARFVSRPSAAVTIAHKFVTQRSELEVTLRRLREKLAPDATVWVSWPKRSSKVATDITEGTIRDVALPMGWVDVKVCAVSDVWSGLKLVVRKSLR